MDAAVLILVTPETISQFPALTPPQTNCFVFHKWVRVNASFGTLAVQYLHLRINYGVGKFYNH